MAPAVPLEKAALATQRATLMFGCFRRDDAADPEIFLDAAIAILTDYPNDVIMAVTDPRTGIPGRQKWPPQPCEVKDACEAIEAPRRREREREERIARQLAERETADADRDRRPSYDDLKAKHGPTWGIDTDDPHKPRGETAERAARRIAARDNAIMQDYAACGVEPVMAGDMIVSPSLLRALDRWPLKGQP